MPSFQLNNDGAVADAPATLPKAPTDTPAPAAKEGQYPIVPVRPITDESGNVGGTNLSPADYEKMFGQGKSGAALTVVAPKPEKGKTFELKMEGAGAGSVPKYDSQEQSPPSEQIDYSQGAPLMVRIDFQAAENPKEKALALSQYYPPGDFGVVQHDGLEEWWVKKDGKKVPVLPSDNSWGAMASNFGTGALAGATPVAGASLGAAVASPGGPGGMAIGAGLGAMGGYALQQGVKALRGISEQAPKEAMGNLALQGGINTIAEGGMGMAGANALRRGYFGVTPQSQKDVARLAQESTTLSGKTPFGNAKLYIPYQTALPDSKLLPFTQNFWNKIISPFGIKYSKALMNRKITDLLEGAGFPKESIPKIIEAVGKGQEVIAPQEAGQAVSGALQAIDTTLSKALDASKQHIDSLVQTADEDIKKLFDAKNPELGRLLYERLLQVRQAMSAEYGRAYDAIDTRAGGKKSVDIEEAVLALRRYIADELPPGAPIPPIMQRIASRTTEGEAAASAAENLASFGANHGMEALQANSKMSIKEVQDTRAWIRDYTLRQREGSLTPGMAYHNWDTVEKALTNALDKTAEGKGLQAKLARQLQQLNGSYKNDIAKFKSTSIKRIVKDSADGVFASPARISKTILNEGAIDESKQVMAHLTPELRMAVGQEYLKNFFQSVSKIDPLTQRSMIDPALLAKGLDKNREIFGTFMPKGLASKLSDLGQQIATANLKVLAPEDVAHLTPGIIKDALEARLTRQKEYDLFLKTNPLAMLMNKHDTEVYDTAAKWAIEPGQTTRTTQVLDTLGGKEADSIRQYAWNGVLEHSLETDVNGNVTVNSEMLRKNFNKYSAGQREALFPNGLDKDIMQVVHDNEFLFPKAKSLGAGGSLAAAAIALHVGLPLSVAAVTADSKFLLIGLHSFLFTRQPVVKFLALESQRNPGMAEEIARTLRFMAVQNLTRASETNRVQRP